MKKKKCECYHCNPEAKLARISELADEVDIMLQKTVSNFLEKYTIDNGFCVDSDAINGLINGIIIFSARNLFVTWIDCPYETKPTQKDILRGFNSKVKSAFDIHHKMHIERIQKDYN